MAPIEIRLMNKQYAGNPRARLPVTRAGRTTTDKGCVRPGFTQGFLEESDVPWAVFQYATI